METGGTSRGVCFLGQERLGGRYREAGKSIRIHNTRGTPLPGLEGWTPIEFNEMERSGSLGRNRNCVLGRR